MYNVRRRQHDIMINNDYEENNTGFSKLLAQFLNLYVCTNHKAKMSPKCVNCHKYTCTSVIS